MKNAFKKLIKILGVIFGAFILLLIGIIIFAPREQPAAPKKEITPEMQAKYDANKAKAKEEAIKVEKFRIEGEAQMEKAKAAARAEKNRIEHEANRLAADVRMMEAKMINEIKSDMHNPDSFTLVEIKCQPNYNGCKDLLVVAIKFRGTNAFGGIITNYKFAELDRKARTYREIQNL
jgi:hypothetical protein